MISGKRMVLCSVRDSAMAAFAPPMTFVAMGQAQRSFRDAVNDKSSGMFVHPEDYELWLIGFFYEDTGEIELVKPECVARAKDVKELLQ